MKLYCFRKYSASEIPCSKKLELGPKSYRLWESFRLTFIPGEEFFLHMYFSDMYTQTHTMIELRRLSRSDRCTTWRSCTIQLCFRYGGDNFLKNAVSLATQFEAKTTRCDTIRERLWVEMTTYTSSASNRSIDRWNGRQALNSRQFQAWCCWHDNVMLL